MTEPLSVPKGRAIDRLHLTADHDPRRRIGVRIERLRGEPRRRPVALLCHGFKGFMDWGFFPALSSAFADAGFLAVSMNTSGSGVSDDPLVMDDELAFFEDTYTKQLSDMAQVRAFAAQHPEALGGGEVLLGHSRGGGMAVISAAEHAPRALVTLAAFDDADRFDKETKIAWRRDGQIQIPNGRTGQIHRIGVSALDDLELHGERLDILAAARRLTAPYLVVHGTKDPTVDVAAAHRLHEAAPDARRLLIDGADHAFGARHPMPPSAVGFQYLELAIAATIDFARAHSDFDG